jgi:hypothetical protein
MIVTRHDFSFFLLRLFLWRLREGGNTRWAGSAHRLAHDIPADGEFSLVGGNKNQETGA